MRKENPFKDENKIDSLLVTIYIYGTFTAESGLLEEAISLGELSYVKNKKLQGELVGWTGKLTNIQEDCDYRSKHFIDLLLPFLQKKLRISSGDRYMEISVFGTD